jgi:Sulfotransferase family
MGERSINNKVCMIGGSGRSGTTILKVIFSKHPDTAQVPEYRFPIDPDGLVDYYMSSESGWSPYLADTRLKRLESLLYDTGQHKMLARAIAYLFNKYSLERYFPLCMVPRYAGIAFERQCPDYFTYVDQLIRALEDFSYKGQWNGSRLLSRRKMYFSSRKSKHELADILGGFWRDIIRSTCANQDKSIFVEDNTWSILWFDKIVDLLPEARLVHVVRDPRDVVASYTKMRWAPDDPLLAARWYKGIINEWFDVKARLNSDRYMEMKLEDLVERPDEMLRRVCAFWGVPWSDCLLETDLSKSHSGRWKTDLSDADGRAVTAELHTELERLGYLV